MNSGQWLWITTPDKRDSESDWQSREPVTDDMKHIIRSAWRVYDDSDASFNGITHEEAVLARHAVDAVSQLKAHIAKYQEENQKLRDTLSSLLSFPEETGVPELVKRLFMVPAPTSTEGEISFFSKASLDYCAQSNERIVKAFHLGRTNPEV
jgi:hypothetical protein